MNELDRSFENIALFSAMINVMNYGRNTQQAENQKALTDRLDKMIDILERIEEGLQHGKDAI